MASVLDKKVEYWEHQLLDLGRRNRMIHYRETKRTTLRLTEPGFEELYRRIAQEEERLTFRRSVDRETDIRVFSVLSLLENLGSPLPVTVGDIGTEGSSLERQKTLGNMRSRARLSLEEQGTNILYLSFGFIEWKDGKGSGAQWTRSPLILVPVSLTLAALRAPYVLSKYEDEIVLNPTLEYYLKTEYGIDLPAFDPDRDTPENYLARLEPIADRRGWRVLREVRLGLLSFQKISMYNDLLHNEHRIKSHPVIRAMAGEQNALGDIPAALRAPDPDSVPVRESFQVLSADSSQQDAILYAKNGLSFVMQGPPGTGKSQTITNIIAEALAAGKKVLFVSEKMAALQVVYRRLQEAHLADFCLPLHSNKASKKEVLAQLGANLELKPARVQQGALRELDILQATRQELNRYAQELHRVDPALGASCYEICGRLEQVSDAPSVAFTLPDLSAADPAKLQMLLEKIREYARTLQRIGGRARNTPWEGLLARETGFDFADKMRRELVDLGDCLHRMHKCARLLPEGRGTYAGLPETAQLARKILDAPAIPENWFDAGELPALIGKAQKMKERSAVLAALEAGIAGVFAPGVHPADLRIWKESVLKQAESLCSKPLMKREEPEFYIENSEKLLRALENARTLLRRAESAFSAAGGLLGHDLPANPSGLMTLRSIRRLMDTGAVLPTGDLYQLRALVQEAKARAEQTDSLRAQILAGWDPAVLQIDSAGMLARFQTGYAGAFKLLDPRYRRDKRQLQAMSKTPQIRLTDDAARDLLCGLRELHGHEEWFRQNDARLGSALAARYAGEQTDWAAALEALDAAGEWRTLPEEYRSGRLAELLSAGDMRTKAELDRLIAECAECFSQMDGMGDLLRIDLRAPDFCAQKGICAAEEAVRGVTALMRRAEQLTPYLVHGDETLDVIWRAAEDLERLAEQSADETENMRLFGALYDGPRTDWDAILSLLHLLRSAPRCIFAEELRALSDMSGAQRRETARAAGEIIDLHRAAKPALAWLGAQFAPGAFDETLPLGALLEKAEGCLNSIDMLPDWIDHAGRGRSCAKTALRISCRGSRTRGTPPISSACSSRDFIRCIWARCATAPRPCAGSDAARRTSAWNASRSWTRSSF